MSVRKLAAKGTKISGFFPSRIFLQKKNIFHAMDALLEGDDATFFTILFERLPGNQERSERERRPDDDNFCSD